MNKVLSILILLISTTSLGQLTSETMDINGASRIYYQYLPTGYDPQTEQLPVVFVLHGIGGTAQNTAGMGMNLVADTARFIVIYPQGEPNNFSQNSWNNGTALESTGEDVTFISRLIDSTNTNYNIDLSRVYVSGISMGSIMTYNLCRYLSDRIAAVACLIGTMSTEDMNNFNPDFPRPTLHMHGTADGTVPYGPPALPSLSLVQETIDQLKVTNGFQGDSTVTALPDNASDGITIDRIVYNCTTPLELWKMNDAGHILPFKPTNDTTTTHVVWYFFSQYTHPNPSTSMIESYAINASVYPNPMEGTMNIMNWNKFKSYQIIDLSGKVIHESKISSKTNETPDLDPGTYLFQFTDIHNATSVQRIIIK